MVQYLKLSQIVVHPGTADSDPSGSGNFPLPSRVKERERNIRRGESRHIARNTDSNSKKIIFFCKHYYFPTLYVSQLVFLPLWDPSTQQSHMPGEAVVWRGQQAAAAGLMHGISRRDTGRSGPGCSSIFASASPISLPYFYSVRCEHGIFFKGGDRAPHNQSACILSVQEVSTVRPGSSAPILYSNLLNKTVHYFLDTQYVTHFM